MQVLLVDDDTDLLDLMTYALRREGYTVLTAQDGMQALRRIEADRPDIVLVDANMPKLNGFEVCRRIRQDSEIPIIMLTSRDEEEDVLRGLQLGADDYVTKPFHAGELIARVRVRLHVRQRHARSASRTRTERRTPGRCVRRRSSAGSPASRNAARS